MQRSDIQCIVIGAGVVGLAIARKLAMQGYEVMVIDKEEAIGMGVSSRNSEVIHAGLYYPPGSLKAKLCVQGKEMLYQYCHEKNISHQRLGKLLVATNESQIKKLESINHVAQTNGVNDLQFLSKEQAQALEPELSCVAALLSPSTGIVDSHGLMLALQGDAENHGAQSVFNSPLLSVDYRDGLFYCQFGGDESIELSCDILINAAGLNAPDLARKINGLNSNYVPPSYYCKGSYFSLSGKSPFKRLIYPMPSESGLGVHLTLDLGGQAKFGPDTQWIDEINYEIDESRSESFYQAIRQYWPNLKDNSLQPAYTGIRPKIVGPDEVAADFVIQGPKQHQLPNLINLFGIESPGLTSSLAIAEYIFEVLKESNE
ncbi:dehydrogenase [Pelistega indica]|uniref:Dehydrogenase n=1 Tax=Pelistega indica TaxID=1414851 RepID=V8FQU4_9BURK|nr:MULTISPECIES: NAD(P)/FAD-dependent oxidoreductase [Pelistega]ETD66510.1 dehydrogenase [Pelistega indica]